MNDKKLYMYSGVAIASAIVAYFLITRKSKTSGKDALIEETVITDTGSEIPVEQAILPVELESVFSLPLKEAVRKIGNKNVYTKVADVKARKGANVNNGFVNNAYGTIADKNTNVGKVIAISEDANGAKNVKGRVYKWVKVNLTKEARKALNESPNESLLNAVSGSVPTTVESASF